MLFTVRIRCYSRLLTSVPMQYVANLTRFLSPIATTLTSTCTQSGSGCYRFSIADLRGLHAVQFSIRIRKRRDLGYYPTSVTCAHDKVYPSNPRQLCRTLGQCDISAIPPWRQHGQISAGHQYHVTFNGCNGRKASTPPVGRLTYFADQGTKMSSVILKYLVGQCSPIYRESDSGGDLLMKPWRPWGKPLMPTTGWLTSHSHR